MSPVFGTCVFFNWLAWSIHLLISSTILISQVAQSCLNSIRKKYWCRSHRVPLKGQLSNNECRCSKTYVKIHLAPTDPKVHGMSLLIRRYLCPCRTCVAPRHVTHSGWLMLELSAIPAEAALSSKMMAYKLPSPQPMNWVSLFESKS